MEEELSKLDALMGCSWSKYDNLLPDSALVSSSTHTNDPNLSFIGRARFEEIITGSVNPRSKKCSFSFGLKEYSFDKFEVLKNTGNYSWENSSNGDIPPNAIVGGKTFSTGERVYIGRAQHDEMLIQGRIIQSQGCLCYHHDGVEFSSRVYEVLVKSDLNDEGPKWISCSSSSAFKLLFLKFQSFVCTTTNKDGPVFVGRVTFQEIIPGNIIRSDKNAVCCITTGNREYLCKDFKVLLNTHHDLTWEKSSNGFIHENAVVGGKSATGETLYIGRTKRNSIMILGKIQPSSGCMFYASDGVEYSASKYEVLVKVKARFFSNGDSNLEEKTESLDQINGESTKKDNQDSGIIIKDNNNDQSASISNGNTSSRENTPNKLKRQDNIDSKILKDIENQIIIDQAIADPVKPTKSQRQPSSEDNPDSNIDNPDSKITAIFHQDTHTSIPEQNPLKTIQILYETMEEGLDAIKNYEPPYITDIIEHSIKIKFVVRFFTDDEIKELENIFDDPKKSVLIAISNESESKFQICWRVKKKRKFLDLFIESDGNSTVNNLIKNFLSCCLNSGHSGLDNDVDQDNDLNNLNVNLFSLYDAHGCNLMMFAAKSQNLPAIKYFINAGFDVTYKVGDLYAIDFLQSDSNNYSEMVVELLKANSPFPKKFYDQNISADLKEFVTINQEMHQAIKDKNFNKIHAIIKDHPSQRHFYIPNPNVKYKNTSAYECARKINFFKVLSILKKEFITPGPFESQRGTKSVKIEENHDEGEPLLNERSNDIELNRKSYRESRLDRQSTSLSIKSDKEDSKSIFRFLPWKRQSFAEEIKNSLQSITILNTDENYKEKIDLIHRIYKKLTEVIKLRSVLELVSKKTLLTIKFDENKELEESAGSAQYLNQYMEKQIIIGVKNLLVEEKFEFLCGKVAQKLCNFAIFDVFKNSGKPYSKDREGRKKREEFKGIARECEKAAKSFSNELVLQEIKQIHQKFTNECQQHAELISIVPLILSNNDQEDYKKNRNKCPDLFDYFGYCSDKMNHKIRLQSEFMHKKVIFGVLIMFVAILLIGAVTYKLNKGKKWHELSKKNQEFILNQNVLYHGVQAEFRDFFKLNESCLNEACLNELDSSQITKALEALAGKSELLSGELINLQPCIHFDFNLLTDGLRSKLKHSDIDFQASKVRLKEVVGNYSEIYLKLTSDEIKKIFNNNMTVGEPFKPLNANFIVRKFKERTGTTQKSFENLSDEIKTSKVFILADEIGSGKSATMKNFTSLLKDKYPNYWVAYIDVKKFKNRFDEEMIERLKINATHFMGEQVLDLKLFNFTIFSNLFKFGKVIFIWDNIKELENQEKRFFRELIKFLKNSPQNIQIIAVDREDSRKFEDIFNTISHEFVPFDKNDRAKFIRNIMERENGSDFNEKNRFKNLRSKRSIGSETISQKIESTIEKIESFIKSENKSENFNFISSNNPLFLNLSITSAQKPNFKEIFSNFYLLFKNYVDSKGFNEHSKIYQRNALATISSGHILNWKSLEIEGKVDELFTNLPETNNLEIFHPSMTKFFIVQFFYEFFYTEITASESQVDLTLKLLEYFSNFNDDKLVRNLIAGLPLEKVENVKNPGKKQIILKKCKNILGTFNSTENPGIFVSFFAFDDEISTAIGSPQDWLKQKLNITRKSISNITKSHTLAKFKLKNPEDPQNLNSFEENHQKGKIYFQLWLNREFPSINSILAFTKIPMNEEFLLDLLAKQEFMDFYKFAYKNLNRAEIREFLINYKKEIFDKFLKSVKDKDIVDESMVGILNI